MEQKTWYSSEGSKLAELWTILHLPYTLMCLSFLTVGFAINGMNIWALYFATIIAYFFGLGIAAHSFDQIEEMGSSYVKYLTQVELKIIGTISLAVSVTIGLIFISEYSLYQLIWLMPLQVFFVLSYPIAKLFKGTFHSDFWFAVSFGAIPVIIGNYINTASFSYIAIEWALFCFVISYIEITLSRYARNLRKENKVDMLEKPEKALKLLCILSYLLAIIIMVR